MKKTTSILLTVLSLFLLSGCVGMTQQLQADATPSITPTPSEMQISHNGITYGVVTSPYSSRVWLDKNIGAKNICSSLDDKACYGDYYQWGRGFDGHQKSTSKVSSKKAKSLTKTDASFIVFTQKEHTDWAKIDNDGSLREAIWSKTDGSAICPKGFRVPTIEELKAELFNEETAHIQNNTDAFLSFLKLPSAGNRYGDDAKMGYPDTWGYYWSSSVEKTDAMGIYFGASKVGFRSGSRTYGRSIRCIEE